MVSNGVTARTRKREARRGSATLTAGPLMVVAILAMLPSSVPADVSAEAPRWHEHASRWINGVFNAPRRGSPAPVVLGCTSDGQVRTLADYPARFVLVAFWASWCPPCREEAPALSALTGRLTGTDIAVIAVNVHDDAATAGRFAHDHLRAVEVLHDADGTVAKRYAVGSLPAHVLIDTEEGRIVRKWRGRGDLARIEPYLIRLLAESSGP